MSGNLTPLDFTEYHCHAQLDALKWRHCAIVKPHYVMLHVFAHENPYTHTNTHYVLPLFLQAGVPWKELDTTATEGRRL